MAVLDTAIHASLFTALTAATNARVLVEVLRDEEAVW
jgi:hypothetical protein